MKLISALRNMKQLQSLTIAMVCSNIILAMGVSYAMVALGNNHERVVLVPPNLDKKAEIAWTSANREYIKSFGLYMATLVGNVQPKSSTVVLDSVSAFMDPAIYTDFRKQLMTIIEDPVFKASGSVISFLPSSIQYEVETSRVFVTGAIITSTAGSTKYTKNVIYELGVRIREGRPWVTHFTSYEGTNIHSVNWWAQKASKDGTVIPNYALPDKWNGKEIETSVPSDFSVMKMDEGVKPGITADESKETPQEQIVESAK
ncbi:hypothetical protein OX89_04130 [Diaphorobacter sp. J5-51]|nr:hypothetical protein OX89_04130 [Diaphorobacter sp. J5-51]